VVAIFILTASGFLPGGGYWNETQHTNDTSDRTTQHTNDTSDRTTQHNTQTAEPMKDTPQAMNTVHTQKVEQAIH
jgi:hypothetical protein